MILKVFDLAEVECEAIVDKVVGEPQVKPTRDETNEKKQPVWGVFTLANTKFSIVLTLKGKLCK